MHILHDIIKLLFFITAYDMSPDEGQEELEEVQADIKKREEEVKFNNFILSYLPLEVI